MRPPTDRDVIPGKWVYKVKLGPIGQVDKFKARYIANGVKQVEGLDYFDFCAYLLTRDIQDSISTISEAKPCDAPVRYRDSFHALSNREQPQEFVKQGADGGKLVCRLNQSTYGLKQAANNW